jgi:hypothetical protein
MQCVGTYMICLFTGLQKPSCYGRLVIVKESEAKENLHTASRLLSYFPQSDYFNRIWLLFKVDYNTSYHALLISDASGLARLSVIHFVNMECRNLRTAALGLLLGRGIHTVSGGIR